MVKEKKASLWEDILYLAVRIYIVIALLISAIFSPLPYLLIPLGILLFYLLLEIKGKQIKLPFYLFLALSLPLLQPVVAWVKPLFSLPVIFLLDRQLKEPHKPREEKFPKWGRGFTFTSRCRRLFLSLVMAVLVGVALDSPSLLLSSSLLAAYITGVILITRRQIKKMPLQVEVLNYRVLANEPDAVSIMLYSKRLRGEILLNSPYPWFKVQPAWLTLNKEILEIKATFTPPLSGPSTIQIKASFLDSRGLVRKDFPLEVMHLLVIPRAQYAGELARRYLEMSRGGGIEAMTLPPEISLRRFLRGVEFEGLRSYQPGDSAKDIDWKHTIKLRQLIVKEFLGSGAESAIMVVNLSVLNEEEKDRLAYNLITTALTLALENIPSSLAAYNHQGVVRVTPKLSPRKALIQALNLIRDISFLPKTHRYLGAPDIFRLRANIRRLQGDLEGSPAAKLAWLLSLEYEALRQACEESPATWAIKKALARADGRPNILLISTRNHDTDALAFIHFALQERGYRVASIG